MPRRFSVDGDDSRLPDGMTRIGYDADTQTYTFRDNSDGSLWEGPPGCEYGRMTRVAAAAPKLPSVDIELGETGHHPRRGDDDNDEDAPPSYDESEEAAAAVPFLDHSTYTSREGAQWDSARHWRSELMPLLNFFMILALFLLGLFWFLGWMTSSSGRLTNCAPGAHAHQIQKGESCWSIAQMHGIGVDQLQAANGAIDCDLLRVGAAVCVPAMPKI